MAPKRYLSLLLVPVLALTCLTGCKRPSQTAEDPNPTYT